MLIEQHADSVVIRAPAKVNLYLEVLAKRADGYHEIETLLVALSLHDKLEFKEESSGPIQLQCQHPELSTGTDNLVYRAAALLQERTGCKRGVRIRLDKRIPMAAGLGGGSSDAAATLEGLNRLWGLGLAANDLAQLGAELGSDVPFFFAAPAAWCKGRGEQVTPLDLKTTLHFVLVCPREGLSTAAVYRQVQVPAPPQSGQAIRAALVAGDVEEIGRQMFNRLQEPAERLCPAAAYWRERLAEQRPAGCLMSGSGSSLFALCRDQDEAQRIAHGLCHGSAEGAHPLVCVETSSS